MRFRLTANAVAVALLTATTFQFGTICPASAKGFFPPPKWLRFKPVTPAPPPVQAAPTNNVKDFGAKGDGTTDDTDAINNASTDARATGKGVFFPAGTYLHSGILTFNSVAVTGVGGASVIQASDSKCSAVVLTGIGPTIQNVVISTGGLSGCGSPWQPKTATIYVHNATNFAIQNDTLVQGQGRIGVQIERSNVGNVSAVTFNGMPGDKKNVGVLVDGCSNVGVIGNLLMNEAVGVEFASFCGYLYSGLFSNQFCAAMFNTMNPIANYGVIAIKCNTMNISSNGIVLDNQNNCGYPVYLIEDANMYVLQNVTSGGNNGVYASELGTGIKDSINQVNQNTIRNTNYAGIYVTVCKQPTGITLNSNLFGECGLLGNNQCDSSAVFNVYGSKYAVATVQIMNNSYQGHNNGLASYVFAPKVPGANVSGNTQTQTNPILPSVTGP